MFRNKEFRDFYIVSGGSVNSANSYVSNLNKVNSELVKIGWGGLDEALLERGSNKVLEWAMNVQISPVQKTTGDARSALKKYIEFHETSPSVKKEITIMSDEPLPDVGSIFQLEKEMQHSVRKQLDRLEAGLVAIDNGNEYVVSTGRIDILAKDVNGKHVIIELKAGICPSGALEQALGYAQDVLNEVDDASDVRVFIIASEFKPRILAAAKLIPVIQLRKYEFSLSFNEV
jgi:RecB family endonuclease NucS